MRGQALLGVRRDDEDDDDEEEDELNDDDEEDEEDEEEDDEDEDDNDDDDDDEADDITREERLAAYEKLLNAEGDEEDRMLSPKYNMNIYNILEKHYEQKEQSKVILTVHNLNYEIGSKRLMTNLNFQVNKSECVGLIGNNGCGKTSLLNLIFDHSDNSHKSININNSVSKEGVTNFNLTEENMQAMVKKNKFDFLYKILHHMKMNSLDLSKLPSIIKNRDVSYFEKINKKKSGNSNDLFFKNGIFYFKQNIHLLEKNNLTVFEKVLKFYQPVLEKYEVLNYIEREISLYRNVQVVQKSNRCQTEEDSEKYPTSDSLNGNNIPPKRRSYTTKEHTNNMESVETKSSGEPTIEQAQSFAQSKLFQMVLKLYMHEKENVFKEINQVKMNFHKYLNILNLKNLLHVKLSNLSNGYIIRVYLLLLLLSNAKLLLIDEINNNLDIFNIFFVMNIFHYSLKYKEIGIVLASHDFFLVSKLCNRILDFNKIYGHDIDFNNMALLKRISRSGQQAMHSDVPQELQRKNEHNSNITFFKGNYTQYLHSMKILFDNRRKKKEELKKIMDDLSAAINQVKKKKKNEFMRQSLKKKEEEFKLFQNVYSTLFDSTLNYQYMYYNLIYSRKNEKGASKGIPTDGGIQEGRENISRVRSGSAEGNSNGQEIEEKAAQQTDGDVDEHTTEQEEGVESFVYNKMKDIEGNMNKNILIDMSKKIKNNELIETGERYAKNNVSLYEFDNFSFYFWNKKKKKKKYIFKNMNLSINSGENVLLLGKNGIGKSTFFKILTNRYKFQMQTEGGRHRRSAYAYGDSEDEEEYQEGGVYVHGGDGINSTPTENKIAHFEGSIKCNFDNVLLTYFEQNMIKKLHLEINEYFRYLIENVNYEPVHFDDSSDVEGVDDITMENYDGYNFDNGMPITASKEHFFFYVLNKTKPFCNEQDISNIEEKIKALLKIFYIDSSTCMKDKSGGEKVRILFLSLFLKKSNLLLLDEINNNLDIYLKNLLLNFLNYIYQGSYILTTHDFYMIKNLTNVHKVIYIFDYQNVFTFYNVQDFIENFYHFILHSFDTLHMVNPRDGRAMNVVNHSVDLQQTQQPEVLHSPQRSSSVCGDSENNETAKNPLHNGREEGHPYADAQEEDNIDNRENYNKILYDNYDYKILQFLKTQYAKDRNERKNIEQITDHEEDVIFEKKKVNRKNFGGKGSSGKIKIKNWKRWKK
eukprot:XP_002262151.1 ABC transporter, putative [Plasmodium knowlesi strain H]